MAHARVHASPLRLHGSQLLLGILHGSPRLLAMLPASPLPSKRIHCDIPQLSARLLAGPLPSKSIHGSRQLLERLHGSPLPLKSIHGSPQLLERLRGSPLPLARLPASPRLLERQFDIPLLWARLHGSPLPLARVHASPCWATNRWPRSVACRRRAPVRVHGNFHARASAAPGTGGGRLEAAGLAWSASRRRGRNAPSSPRRSAQGHSPGPAPPGAPLPPRPCRAAL